ncbi:MAG: enoyl-ACP reductase [Bacteroidetes bacterium]|nr:enoyl-ACP reductase [Bacteroidota bacterium]
MSENSSYGLLKGKRGIVFGPLDESSIGWQIALAAHREGARLAISNVGVALRVGKVRELAELCDNAPVYACDATNNEELDAMFAQVVSEFGPVDFIVHSIGMSQNIRKGLSYDRLNYDWFIRTLDVSALSLHRVVTAALRHDAIADGASIVAMTYIASQRNYSTYSDMGDAKALLESVTRSLGPHLAKRRIRINTVSQSPTYTRAGSGIENFDKMFDFADRVAPLGNASAEECGDYVVTLLSDLTRKVTMQNLFHDGGYSAMGMTIPLLSLFHTALQDDDLTRAAGLEPRKEK